MAEKFHCFFPADCENEEDNEMWIHDVQLLVQSEDTVRRRFISTLFVDEQKFNGQFRTFQI